MKRDVLPFRAELLFIFTLLILAGLLGGVLAVFHVDDSKLISELGDGAYNTGWQLIGADGSAQSIGSLSRQAVRNRGQVVIENRLPQALCQSCVFGVRTYSEKMRVWIDDEPVYSYGWDDDVPFGGAFGSVLNLVDIPVEAAGGILRVELTPISPQTHPGDYAFYLTSRENIIFQLISRNLFVIANGFFVLTAAAMLIVMGIVFLVRGTKQGGMRLFLGLFIVIEQLWSLSDAYILQLFVGNKAFSYMLTFLSFMLMPAPLLLCVSSVLPQCQRRYRAYACLSCLNTLACFAVYSLGWLDLFQMVPINHVLIIVFSADGLITCLHSRKSSHARLLLFGLCGLILSTAASIAAFYFTHMEQQGPLNYSLFVSIGMDILILSVYVSILRASVSNAQLAMRADRLAEQAYSDQMTGLYNRTAFEMRVEELKFQTAVDAAIFMVDLNNLKRINDSMGHRAGDLLIRALGDCLKAAFNGVGDIYRYGGDEFVVICLNCDAEGAAAANDRLQAELESCRRRGQYLIDVASGYAVRDANHFTGMPLMSLFMQADMDMYESKRRYKAAHPQEGRGEQPGWMDVDPSTGLMTFLSFRQRLRSHLYDHPDKQWAILNFDIDGFDQYNARYGWDAGDRLLNFVSGLCVQLCCHSGFCAHGEADNFWMVVDYDDPEKVRKTIRSGAQQFQDRLKGGDCPLNLSVGLYPISDRTLSVGEMCSHANKARRSIKGQDDLLAIFPHG